MLQVGATGINQLTYPVFLSDSYLLCSVTTDIRSQRLVVRLVERKHFPGGAEENIVENEQNAWTSDGWVIVTSFNEGQACGLSRYCNDRLVPVTSPGHLLSVSS
jgi:hypothetical protein